MPIPMSLQPLLRQPYSRDTYRTILEDILPSGTLQLLQTPQAIIATCEFVTATSQIGTIELPDGNTIALLEVHVADQIKLARNRVALRNFVARFIDEASTTAVLAVFHQQGKPDWRLTYACKRSQLDDDTLEITSTQTAPRRYTFLLGENEPCRTAAGRMAELREKGEHLTLEEVEKAFSVERLNKDFFKDYKKHYEAFTAHLLAPANAKTNRTAFGIATHAEEADQDKADKPIRDFVKRLLGRLVFLHFLQKKGWMGCKAGGKSWTGGDPDFLNSYFTHAESKQDAHRFHSRWLIPLFFEALNKDENERPGYLFKPTGNRIPYLNGGLFETDPAPLHALDFPAELFRTLLEFFGQYHFTIDENDPEDHEVGIDPEMLGHIFENLLEDNKDKGAYYTPKAIVSYMARQSLLHYLETHLGENPELALLLNEKDHTNHPQDSFVAQNADRIADLLEAVKICDPAIGSGAFPIGLLHEILWTRVALNLQLNNPTKRAELKRRIIQNSIHGVDLDPGAVEIARLRFWLALVVDEDQPRPLPNLDYKIHRADSLIEYIRGEPVHLGKVSAEDKRTHGAIQSLIAAKAALFTAQKLPDKRAARFALYRALAEVAMAEFTWLRNDMGLIANDAERAAQLDHGLKEFGHRIKLIDSVAKESAKTQDHVLTDLRAWFDDDKNPTFLWQLHFGEVFAQGGFDIVIANPPYVDSEVMTKTNPELRAACGKRFESARGNWDLYVVFIELGLKMMSPLGSSIMIVPNKLIGAPYAKSIRALMCREGVKRVRDYASVRVFEDVAVYPVVVHVAKAGLAAETTFETMADFQHISRLSAVSAATLVHGEPWDRNFHGFEHGSLAARMGRHSRLKEHCMEVGAAATVAEAYKIAELLYENATPDLRTERKLINTGTIDPYLAKWGAMDTRYIKRGYRHPVVGRTEVGKLSRRRLAQADAGKLIFGGMNLRLECFYDPGDFLAGKSTVIAIPTILDDAHFLVAMLNSRLMTYLYRIENSSMTLAGGYLRITHKTVAELPIPPATTADKARLSQLAEACAAAAQRGDDATVAVHEAEIDQIVYRLFDLTPDEIALIESALAPTRSTTPKRKRAAS